MKEEIKKKNEEPRACPRCGEEKIFSRVPGWCPEGGRWACLKCSHVEKVKNKQ